MMTHIRTAWTSSLHYEIDNVTQLKMITKALSKLEGAVDLVIFDPEAAEESAEDGGRTVRVPWPGLSEKCYAQIDDHGGDTGKVLMIYKASEK